jgi:hypothetical protein
MWQVMGKPVDAGLFAPFKPLEVLYDFDGPRTFTHLDRDGQLCLAHWCDEGQEGMRFLIVPFTEQLVRKLKDGESSLLDALNQPRLWAVDVTHSGELREAWAARLADLPQDVLPLPGTMLLPSLEPLLSLRAVGAEIQEGRIPSSVVSRLVEGVQKTMKMLAEYVLDQPTQTGRPPDFVKRLFDLPTQRIAFGSFEIAFRSPVSGPPELFTGLTKDEIQQEKDALKRIGALLQAGLNWLLSTKTASADNLGQSPDERRLILQAVKNITPSSQGPIQEVEVRGTLIKAQMRPLRLTRGSRRFVNAALSGFPSEREPIVQLSGRIREIDKDRFTFELRGIGGEGASRKFVFEEEFWEDVLEAFQEDYIVTVAGIEFPASNIVEVLAIVRSKG